MRVYADCEFTGLHQNTTLISIGMISEDGREFYAEFNDYDRLQVDQWIYNNIIKNLDYHTSEYNIKMESDSGNVMCNGNTPFVRGCLIDWLRNLGGVEFVLDVGHYDFVLIIDLICDTPLLAPDWVCQHYTDINQELANHLNVSISEAFDTSREELVSELGFSICGNKHNSLYDAKAIKLIYENILR